VGWLEKGDNKKEDMGRMEKSCVGMICRMISIGFY
jgi:hypothetical protein